MRFERITTAWLNMATVVNTVLQQNNQGKFDEILPIYFDPMYSKTVRTVLSNMVTPSTISPSTGADILKNIIVNAADSLRECVDGTLAHTHARSDFPGQILPNQPTSIMHFCTGETHSGRLAAGNAYILPDLDTGICNQLGNTVSNKMGTLVRRELPVSTPTYPLKPLLIVYLFLGWMAFGA